MLRRYFSFAFPVIFSAACGLTYLHFHNAPAAQAENPQTRSVSEAKTSPLAGEIRLAQAETVRQPAVPANKPAKVKKERPQNNDEVKTPMLRNLLDQLEQMNEGTDEDRDLFRNLIYDADVELRDSMGENLIKKINAANKRKPSFQVKASPSQPLKVRPKADKKKPTDKPAETKPAEVKPIEPQPVVPPVVDPAVEPTEPKKDVFDDIFGDKKQ